MPGTGARHYTLLEKKILLETLKMHKDVIENKQSDVSSLRNKERAWLNVTDTYNTAQNITQKRTMQQLKKLWSNMKHQQRDVLTKEKQARLSTGGGPAPELAVVDPDVVLIAPHLLVTAPTLFSSNNSADENKERYELVFDGNLSEAVEEAEAAAQTPTPTPVPAPASAPTQTLEEDGQESWISTTPKPDKRANTVYLTGIKKRKNEQNNEAELRVQRLKELVSQEKELHALKMRSEERLSQIREESETTMYMLKIKTQEFLVAEAAAKAKIAELQLAAVLAPK